MRISADYLNSEPGGEGAGDESKISASHSEHTGTSQDPKLVIEHTSPAVKRVFQDIIWDQ